MRELDENEVMSVSGAGPWLIVGIVLTAIAISDGVHDAVRGYNDARNAA